MSGAWELVVHEPTLRFLLSRPADEREAVFAFLQALAANPTRAGDFEEQDDAGRVYQVMVVGNWCVTYWPDHATKEVRIVRVEPAD